MQIINNMPLEFIEEGTFADNPTPHFRGLAAVFYDGTPNTEYRPTEGVIIRLAPNAFDSFDGQQCAVWYNHSKDFVLGETTLHKSQQGMTFSLPYDATDPDHQKVRAKMNKKIIHGCSFGALHDMKITKEGDSYVQTITKINKLREVSIVNNPAFKNTQINIAASADGTLSKEVLERMFRYREKFSK